MRFSIKQKLKDLWKALNFKAILIGAAVDLGGSLLFGMVMPAYLMISRQSMDPEKLQQVMLSETPISIIIFVFGLLCSCAGGFVAGKIAQKDELINSFCVALLGAFPTMRINDGSPGWFIWGGYIAVFPAGFLGGLLAYNFNQKKHLQKLE